MTVIRPFCRRSMEDKLRIRRKLGRGYRGGWSDGKVPWGILCSRIIREGGYCDISGGHPQK